jgi:hypothetical protein
MSELISSLDAHRYLRATMTASSSQAGWRSLLLRAYDDPPEAEFTTPTTTAMNAAAALSNYVFRWY